MNISNSFSDPAFGTVGRTSASSYRGEAKLASSRSSVPVLLVRHGENYKNGDFGKLTTEGRLFAQNLSQRLARTEIDSVIFTSDMDDDNVGRRNKSTVENIPSAKGLLEVEGDDTNGIRTVLGECDRTAVLCYSSTMLTDNLDLFEYTGENREHPIAKFLNKYDAVRSLNTETRGLARELYHKIHHGEYNPSTGKIALVRNPEDEGDTWGKQISAGPAKNSTNVSRVPETPIPKINDLPRRRTFNFQQR